MGSSASALKLRVSAHLAFCQWNLAVLRNRIVHTAGWVQEVRFWQELAAADVAELRSA